jgi:hypothetical protein
VPEPENLEDENAVAVFIWGRPKTKVSVGKEPVRIGYVPKSYAPIVKRLDNEGRILSVLAHTVGTNDRGVWRCSIVVTYEARQDDITKIREILDSMAVPNVQVAGMIANAADNDEEVKALLMQYEEGCFHA